MDTERLKDLHHTKFFSIKICFALFVYYYFRKDVLCLYMFSQKGIVSKPDPDPDTGPEKKQTH